MCVWNRRVFWSTILLFCLVFQFFSLSGCEKKEQEDIPPVVITNVFHEVLRVPGEGSTHSTIIPEECCAPYYDQVSGEIVLFGKLGSEEAVFHLSSDGNILSRTSISFEPYASGQAKSSGNRMESMWNDVIAGACYAEGILYVSRNPLNHTRAAASWYRFSDNSYHAIQLADYFESGFAFEAYQTFAAWNGTDTFLVSSGTKLLILDAEMQVILTQDVGMKIENVGFIVDGRPAYAGEISFAQYNIYSVDPETGENEQVGHTPIMTGEVSFADEFDYLYTTKAGLTGVLDGKETQLLDARNSGYSSVRLGGTYQLYTLADPEHVLCYDYDNNAVSLWEKTQDINTNNSHPLRIVIIGWVDSQVELRVASFHKDHPNSSIIVEDWNDGQQINADVDKHLFDFVNGFDTPDVIITSTEDTEFLQTIISKKLYQDLTPFLKKDPKLNREGIYPLVQEAFLDEDGGMFAICPNFTIRTVVGLRKYLGEYGKQDSWTVQECLDFLLGVPEGQIITYDLNRDNDEHIFGPSFYNHWIDFSTASCDFLQDNFIDYLRFLRSLPEKASIARQRSGINFFSSMTLNPEYQEIALSGKVLLDTNTITGFFSLFEQDITFDSLQKDNLVRIGFPAEKSRPNAVLESDAVCLITRYCEEPEEAWNFIRELFDVETGTEALGSLTFNADCSAFDEIRKSAAGSWIAVSFSEGIPTISYLDRFEYPTKESILSTFKDISGVYELTPAYLNSIEDYLNSLHVIPIADYTSSEIIEIIDEEISEYLGRGNSEEECAAKIQSRVSIWLAEHILH